MLLLSHLEPVVSDEIDLGNSYILLSAAQEQIYILRNSDIEYIKLFGRPQNYGMFSCKIEEVDGAIDQSAPFCACDTPGMYKHSPDKSERTDLVIDWSR